jgi:hypothetical protein
MNLCRATAIALIHAPGATVYAIIADVPLLMTAMALPMRNVSV